MEYRSFSHNLAFSVQKIIYSMRACTNFFNEIRSGFSKTLIETTVDKTRRWF